MASACLLQAFSEVCFTGVALAPLGVAVVVGRGVSVAAKAAPKLERKRTTSAASLIRDLRFELSMAQALACDRGTR